MKLVRDNIPAIILENQSNCAYAECKDSELLRRLLENKLFEEAKEFIEEYSIVEAADILTVLYYLYNTNKENTGKIYDLDAFLEDLKIAFLKKLDTNGGFSKGYILLNREDYLRD